MAGRKAFYCDQFVSPLPDGHRFLMAKYRMLRDVLVSELPEIITSGRDEEAIRNYIRNQERENERLEQLGLWR